MMRYSKHELGAGAVSRSLAIMALVLQEIAQSGEVIPFKFAEYTKK